MAVTNKIQEEEEEEQQRRRQQQRQQLGTIINPCFLT